MEDPKIAVIGAGNMGSAILRGLLKSGHTEPERLLATNRNETKLAALADDLGIRTTADNREGAAWADVVILGVKPQILPKVLHEITGDVDADKLVVSIAAGIHTRTLEKHLAEGVPVVRSMPNMAVTVDLGATALCRGTHATDAHLQIARGIFESVGVTVDVEEYLMDAVTGLSGTGPMYVFQIIEGLADAGVKVGLSREDAMKLTVQTVLGSATMAQSTGKHPGMLKDMVTSPAGTAITALHTMETNGLRALLMDAVEAARNRARELGDQANE